MLMLVAVGAPWTSPHILLYYGIGYITILYIYILLDNMIAI